MAEPVEILMAEDDAADVELTREALDNCKLLINLNVVKDGVEAMAYLRQEEPYKKAKRPDVILLDLNMPRKNGREVLSEIKTDDNLKDIPVTILTTSSVDEDVIRSYHLGANCYVTKPIDLTQFIKVVQNINEFWFTVVKLPSRCKK